MSWLCINCETVNFDADTKCIVCGDERYYTASELKKIIENNPDVVAFRDENKKLVTQNKWLQTRNKNLHQENKNLKEILANTPTEEAKIKEKTTTIKPDNSFELLQIESLKRKVKFWQIASILLILTLFILLFFF